MAWGRNQIGCACCGDPCRVMYYPFGNPNNPAHISRKYEGDFYFALNTPQGEDSFNPSTGETYQMDLSECGVLLMSHYEICWWSVAHFGFAEFVKFLQRGKTIVIVGEWRDCFSGLYSPGKPGGYGITSTLMTNLGVRGMSWAMPDVFRYGCQTMQNYAVKNNLNKNVNYWALGGSNLINVNLDYAFPLVQDNHAEDKPTQNTVVAAEVVNDSNGKVVLMADQNMLDCFGVTHLPQLLANLCKYNGKPITPIN